MCREISIITHLASDRNKAAALPNVHRSVYNFNVISAK